LALIYTEKIPVRLMEKPIEISRFPVQKELNYFHNLYLEYYAQLVKFSEAIVFDKEEAKDIVQEVFFYLWDNADNVRITSSISGYLFTSVRNKSLNHIKSCQVIDRHNERVREAYLFACHLEPDDTEEVMGKIRETIDKFPSQMKKVILLRTEKEMKYEEIANELDVSINTVKSHLKRGFRLLRKIMLILLIQF
jgi:RNA polymerase sigma-70 factor (family 1)